MTIKPTHPHGKTLITHASAKYTSRLIDNQPERDHSMDSLGAVLTKFEQQMGPTHKKGACPMQAQ